MADAETLNDLKGTVEDVLDGIEFDASIAYGELTLRLAAEDIIQALKNLRNNSLTQFVALTDISGVDWPGRARRFDVVYQLLSPALNARIRLKIETGEDQPVASATSVFAGADWYEREAYDMYGILFTGHPDLRRLLTDYGFEGYPLRKDFPLSGFNQVRYDDEMKRVVYEPVSLRQEFRDFDFESPWEGTDYVLPGDEKASS